MFCSLKKSIGENLWDTDKAVLKGKFIVIKACLKKEEKSQINNLTLYLKNNNNNNKKKKKKKKKEEQSPK